jgi:maleate isomerase
MWRARIGILYPGDGLLDDEFWRLAPAGVGVFVTRTMVPRAEVSAKVVEELASDPDIEQSALRYAIDLSSIAFACTSVSFFRGAGGDQEIIERIEKAAGVPATTTSTAAVKALQALGTARVAVATPYVDEINDRLADFLAGHGFLVVAMKGLQLGRDIGLVPAGDVYQFVKGMQRPEADAIFISCTNFATVEILDALEQDLGLPVISANQVTMWEALNLAGVKPFKPGCGSLFNDASKLATDFPL